MEAFPFLDRFNYFLSWGIYYFIVLCLVCVVLYILLNFSKLKDKEKVVNIKKTLFGIILVLLVVLYRMYDFGGYFSIVSFFAIIFFMILNLSSYQFQNTKEAKLYINKRDEQISIYRGYYWNVLKYFIIFSLFSIVVTIIYFSIFTILK